VVPLELPSYREGELGRGRDLLPAGAGLAARRRKPETRGRRAPKLQHSRPDALGFRNRDDVTEVTALLDSARRRGQRGRAARRTPADLARHAGEADFNVVLYPEIADTAARWLERLFGSR
jgi:light-independent protochlorophyllide reductase subunit B